jgi:hypothetical protein
MNLLDYQNEMVKVLLNEAPSDLLVEKGLNPTAIKTYQKLIKGTFVETLENFYPLSQPFFNDQDWQIIINEYRAQHPSQHYQLFKIGEAFPDFLKRSTLDMIQKKMNQFPYLPDIAKYEWAEVLVLNSPLPQEATLPPIMDFPFAPEKLSTTAPAWNNESEIIELDFPVPQILEDLKQSKPEDLITFPYKTDVLIYKDNQKDSVRFFVLNSLTLEFIQLSQKQPQLSFQALLDHLVQQSPELSQMESGQRESLFLGLLNQLFAEQILLGYLEKD